MPLCRGVTRQTMGKTSCGLLKLNLNSNFERPEGVYEAMRHYVSTPVMRSLWQGTPHPSSPSSTQLILSLCLCLITTLHCRLHRRLECTPLKLLAERARQCAALSVPLP